MTEPSANRLHPHRNSLERLCERLVLIETGDLQALARLHTTLLELAAAIGGSPAIVLNEGAQIVERIILEEEKDPSGALLRFGGQVEALLGKAEDASSATAVTASASPAPPASPSPGPEPLRCELPVNVDDDILAEFLGRQPSVLEQFEALVLQLDRPDSGGPTQELRRLIHTLKGESALLGLRDVERLCHTVEEAFDQRPLAQLGDLLLEVKDWLSQAWESLQGRAPQPPPPHALLGRLLPSNETTPLDADPDLLAEFINEAHEHLEACDVNLLTLETDSSDHEALNAVFRAFHTIKGVAGFLGLTEIGKLAHEAENLLDRARKGELTLTGGAMDAIFDAADAMKRMIAAVTTALKRGTGVGSEPALPGLLARIVAAQRGEAHSVTLPDNRGRRLGEILLDQGVVSSEGITHALAAQQAEPQGPRLGEILVRGGDASARDVAQALRSQRGGAAAVEVKETIKVDTERLDRLIEMIGELVIVESMVSGASELRQVAAPPLLRSLTQLDKITRELQEMGMGLRMVPLRSTFQKMARLVRDLGRKSGKQVELVTSGDETELDKTVVDRIGDPLIHMVRNAVDHGLEPDADARRAAGKPEIGRVELRAYHKGGNIYIEISDDGRGLDAQAILAKARERGLVRDGETPSEREIFQYIFEPGLSTARKVTDVSGRGVGMDVVKRNIADLRGHVEVNSERGVGSTFTIRLPLTLAIIDGMVVRVGDERLIVPTLSIVRSIRPRPEEITTVLGRGELIDVQGRLIPLFRIGALFGMNAATTDPTEGIVVIVEEAGHHVGLLADELLGQQQIVIKSLGEWMHGLPGIAGGAIMTDGRVGLILDSAALIRLARDEEIDIAAPAAVREECL